MPQAELKSNEEWRAWGEEDPMYGVASWPERRQDGANPWTTDEFYAIGKSDWDAFFTVWRRNFRIDTGTALEIGAGAGRMTKQLAAAFEAVKALDVSPAMFEFAKAHVAADNVDWLLTDGLTFPVPNESIDAIFSCHVFQHFNDFDAVASNFRECARVLKPGGSLCIHLPVHHFPDVNRRFARVSRKLYGGFLKVQRIMAERRRKSMRKGKSEPYMHGISVERDRLFGLIGEIGLVDPLLVTLLPPDALNSLHTLILAAKPQAG